ncbi:MAG TPA: methyltransferase, partial [Polyangiaceae bacterium]|nr:methyltransferase [Polyangiaceae bacterium]
LVAEDAGGRLAAVDLREVRGPRARVLVTLVLNGGGAPKGELECAGAAVSRLSADIAGVAVNYRNERSPQVLGATTRVLSGTGRVRDDLGPAYQLASHGSFVQAHRSQAAHIRAIIANRLAETAPVLATTKILDVYGGSGALSLPLAHAGASVTLVESFGAAADSARAAAREQNLERFVVVPGDAARVLRDLGDRTFDLVITNPPRRGMVPPVREAIAGLKPRAIAYVSCDPETLARDLEHFGRLGYAADGLEPVDMIPLTDQVETVAWLVKSDVAAPRTVFENDDICIVDKPAHEAATHPARNQEELVWSVPSVTSGLAVFAKGHKRVAMVRASLDAPDTRKTHVVLARGITPGHGAIAGRTRYQRIAVVAGQSLLRVTVPGEQKFKILEDLARVGHAVIGDALFGHPPTNRHFEEKYILDRPFLHCARLEFFWRESLSVTSPLPGQLATVLIRAGYLPSKWPNEW